MSTKRATRHNAMIVEFLQSKIQPAQQVEFSECRLFDDDGSKYLLQREQELPNVIRLSISLAGFADYAALSASLTAVAADLQSRYQNVCRVVPGVGTCQLKLDILCEQLLSLSAEQQQAKVQSMASVRADTLTWLLR